MKKLAIAFSSKDRVDLTEQTLRRLLDELPFTIYWNDGSATEEGRHFNQCPPDGYTIPMRVRVTGGPDRAIVFALSQMLFDKSWTHVGLLEQDVLLDPGWLEPTLQLFDNPDGLPVGAVSARSYEDRVLLQRDGYAVMHNVGAGHIIFTREAARIILDNYRTGWWPENRAVFSQLSGIDIGKFAAFHHNEQMTTADWSWDTILAAHGLATVALTPSKATMIGQDMSLEQQGLRYGTGMKSASPSLRNESIVAFTLFRENLLRIRSGKLVLPPVDHLLRTRSGNMIMPHQADRHCGIFRGRWTTRWNQATGPFTYVAGADASFQIPLFGPCAFHVGAGPVRLHDEATGFNTEIDLTGQDQAVTIAVPRDMQHGIVRLEFGPGACLVAIETTHPQPVLKDVTFDYSKLPETA